MALHIRNGDWILIGDGKKALLLVNEGDADLLNLRRRSIKIHDNPATHKQGSDRPGRTLSNMSSRHSAYSQTDWHEIEENRFADQVAELLNRAAQAGEFKHLHVIAPPKTLGELRQSFSDETIKRIVSEIDKDLTKHSISQIEKLVLTYEV